MDASDAPSRAKDAPVRLPPTCPVCASLWPATWDTADGAACDRALTELVARIEAKRATERAQGQHLAALQRELAEAVARLDDMASRLGERTARYDPADRRREGPIDGTPAYRERALGEARDPDRVGPRIPSPGPRDGAHASEVPDEDGRAEPHGIGTESERERECSDDGVQRRREVRPALSEEDLHARRQHLDDYSGTIGMPTDLSSAGDPVPGGNASGVGAGSGCLDAGVASMRGPIAIRPERDPAVSAKRRSSRDGGSRPGGPSQSERRGKRGSGGSKRAKRARIMDRWLSLPRAPPLFPSCARRAADAPRDAPDCSPSSPVFRVPSVSSCSAAAVPSSSPSPPSSSVSSPPSPPPVSARVSSGSVRTPSSTSPSSRIAPSSVARARRAFRKRNEDKCSDEIAHFVAAKCDVLDGPDDGRGSVVRNADLHAAYMCWHNEVAASEPALGPFQLSQLMQVTFPGRYERHPSRKGNFYRGIRLRSPDLPASRPVDTV